MDNRHNNSEKKQIVLNLLNNADYAKLMRTLLSWSLRDVQRLIFHPPFLFHRAMESLLINRRSRSDRYQQSNLNKFLIRMFEELRCQLDIFEIQDKNGRTLLHWALLTCNDELVDLLIENRSPLMIRDEDDVTPLELAMSCENQSAFEKLIKKGAQFHFLIHRYCTPSQLRSLNISEQSSPDFVAFANYFHRIIVDSFNQYRERTALPYYVVKNEGPTICFPCEENDRQWATFKWDIEKLDRILIVCYLVHWDQSQNKLIVSNERAALSMYPILMSKDFTPIASDDFGIKNFQLPGRVHLVKNEFSHGNEWTLKINLSDKFMDSFLVCQLLKIV